MSQTNLSTTVRATKRFRIVNGDEIVDSNQDIDLEFSDLVIDIGIFTQSMNGLVPAPNEDIDPTKFLCEDGTWQVVSGGGGGGGVSTVSVVTANGVSGTVLHPTTTPAITITLGAITPSSVAATGTVTGSNLSGTNTGDQTITLTGDVTGTGSGSFATTIGANKIHATMLNADVFGSTSSTACVGNDSRLSNSRTPVGTALASADIWVGNVSNLAAQVAVSGDVTISNTGVTAIGATTIHATMLNADVFGSSSTTACIGNDSRLSDARTPVGTALTSANIWIGNGSNVAAAAAMTGDITITNAGVTAIGSNKVTFAKIVQVAALSLVANPTGSTANLISIGLGNGLDFAGGGNLEVSFGATSSTVCVGNDSRLSDARTPVGTALTSANIWIGNVSNLAAAVAVTGDITITNAGVTAIGANKVTYAQMQQASTVTLLGNPTGGNANLQEITLGSGLAFSGSTLIATSAGGSVTSVSVVTANGVSGSVATATTTPAITITLGAITPSSVAATGAVTGSNLSGTNTGDQTITLTGDVTGSGTGSFATVIGVNKVHATMLNSDVFGSSGTTACVGNDSRLSDARTPVGTTLTSADIWIGNGSNLAAQVAITGDVTLTNAGLVTITKVLNSLPAPTGSLSLNSQKITSLLDPVSAQDAATKNYVDTQVALLAIKKECQAATTAALAASTYANGSSGVGATLTLTVAAVLILDGYTPALNDRLLIKNQADATENGIYTVTTLGVAAVTQAVLTRSLDFNQPTDGINGAFVFIQNGTVNISTGWLCTTYGSITFGHGNTSINWTQDTGSGTYTGTTPISVNASNQISVSTGSTSSTVCIGNDSRLSDARTPVGTALTSASIWIGNVSNLAAAVAVTGDVTITNAGVTAIGANKVTTTTINGNAVTYAKVQQLSTVTLLGNSTGGAANVQEITLAASLAFTSTVIGVVFGSSGTTACVGNDSRLSDARTPVGTALTSASIWIGNVSNLAAAVAVTGDVTITNAGVTAIGANKVTTTTINGNAVTYAKVQQLSTVTLLGNSTGGAANVQEITLAASLAFTSTVLGVSFGSSGTTACVGNDSRLSDARTPVGTALTSASIWIGNVSNLAAAIAVTGDVTITNAGVTAIGANKVTTTTINASAVTYAKIQNASASTLIGNPTTGATVVSEITLGAGVSFSDIFLNANQVTSLVNDIEILANSTTTIIDDPYQIASGQVTIIDSGGLLNLTLTNPFNEWTISVQANDIEVPPNATMILVDDPYVISSGALILDNGALLNLTLSNPFEDWVTSVRTTNVEIPPNSVLTIVDDPYIIPSNTVTIIDNSGVLCLTQTQLQPFASGTMAVADKIPFNSATTGLNKTDTVEDLLLLLGRGYIDGCNITFNNTTSVDFGAGVCASTTSVGTIRLMKQTTSPLNKTTSSWAVGHQNGGLFGGTIAVSTWYHCFIIRKDADGTIDAGFSTSLTASDIPQGYTAYRRIGSVLTDGSSHFIQWTQYQDEFWWNTSVLDISVTAPGNTAVTRTLASVPTGVKVSAIVMGSIFDTTPAYNALYLSDLATADLTVAFANGIESCANGSPGAVAVTMAEGTAVIRVWTNTSAQIRSRILTANALAAVKIRTLGWVDPRGKNV